MYVAGGVIFASAILEGETLYYDGGAGMWLMFVIHKLGCIDFDNRFVVCKGKVHNVHCWVHE